LLLTYQTVVSCRGVPRFHAVVTLFHSHRNYSWLYEEESVLRPYLLDTVLKDNLSGFSSFSVDGTDVLCFM
jgi:hypothetical protein